MATQDWYALRKTSSQTDSILWADPQSTFLYQKSHKKAEEKGVAGMATPRSSEISWT